MQKQDQAIKFPSIGKLFELHDRIISLYGGLPGFRDEGAARSTFGLPNMQLFCDHEGEIPYLYEYPHGMAGAYWFFGAKNHPFHDGNKRTALSAAVVFLCMNGFLLGMKDDQVVKLTVDIASSAVGKDALADIIKKHIKPGAVHTQEEAEDYLLYWYDEILEELSHK